MLRPDFLKCLKLRKKGIFPQYKIISWSVVELWPCLNLFQVVNQAKLIFDVIWGQFCAINDGQWVKSICVSTSLSPGGWTRSSPSCEDGGRSGSTPQHTTPRSDSTPQHTKHATKSSQMVQWNSVSTDTNWPLVIHCKGCLNFYGIFGHCLIS